MRKRNCRRPAVLLSWSVVVIVALWMNVGLGSPTQTATPLDSPKSTVSPDDGPSVHILSPALGEVVKGKEFPIAVQIRAGKHKLSVIELFVDDQRVVGLSEKDIIEVVNSDNQAMFNWDTTLLKDDVHKLTVRVTDSEGKRGSMSVYVAIMNTTVDKSAPTVTFLQPRQTRVRGTVQVVVQAKDDFGVQSVIVYLNSPLLPQPKPFLFLAGKDKDKTTQTFDFTLNTREFRNGDYILYAEAEDFMGNRTLSPPLRLTIMNEAGGTKLDDAPLETPIAPVKPGAPQGGSMITPRSPKAVQNIFGPIATMQFSLLPGVQSSPMPQADIRLAQVQPSASEPGPRVSPQVTSRSSDLLLAGGGAGDRQVDDQKRKPSPHIASRPDPASRTAAKPSAMPSAGAADVRVSPDQSLPSTLPRLPQKPARPNDRLRASATGTARSHTPQATASVGSLPPVSAAPGNRSVGGSEGVRNPTAGSPPDRERLLVEGPKFTDLPKSTSAGVPGAVVITPSSKVNPLGRTRDHTLSAPDLVIPPPVHGPLMIQAMPITETYVVKKGDTLASIAAQKRLNVEMILKVNPGKSLIALRAGQKITLPRRLPVFVDGEQLTKENMGAIVLDGIALAPFRHVFERVGGVVDWHGLEKRVTGVKGAQHVQLRIGDRIALVNGEPVNLQAEPFILFGRTIVPIRFFEKALNLYVEWDRENGRVVMVGK